MKESKISYQVAIVIGAIVIALGVFGSQYMKQQSIEKQVGMKIAQENRIRLNEEAKERTANILYNACLEDAEDHYWDYMELNGEGERYDERGVSAKTRFWDSAKEDKKDAIEVCFDKYKK